MLAEMLGPSVEAAVVALRLKDATSWWDIVNHSPAWQDRIFHVLSVLYGIVAAVALVIMFSRFGLMIYYSSFINRDVNLMMMA